MESSYGAYDGQPFLSPDQLFADPGLIQFVMQYGQDGLDALQDQGDEDHKALIEQLIAAGLLERYEDENGQTRLRLTPQMLKGIEHRALEEIFSELKRGVRDGHRSTEIGRSPERTEGLRPYQFGDPLSELALGETMRNAVARQRAADGRIQPPIRLQPSDFELHQTESSADCATVMLLDLSGSMFRYGRFIQAKRVALGMRALLNMKFPLDSIDFIGFYSLAEPMTERDLPLVMPKPVSIRDYEVRIQVPLEQARQDPERIPLHFTNLQLGLREARRVLARRGASNKQIFVVTDGQPTAHVDENPDGQEILHLLYPPTQATREATLKEAMKCRQSGIRIASFALIEDYWGMDWVGFIEQMTRLTRGVAYYCTSDDLSSTVIESYLTGKKSKSFLH
ncbi:MAG: VWA domain-containing protein [Planctomycetota bacterium]